MSRLPELSAKIDAFFDRVTDRHGNEMQCHTGCADCCHVRLTVTSVEVAAIADEIATWTAERKRALAAVAHENLAAAPTEMGARCAALDAGDRCAIYTVRPVVCRSHGAPIRLREVALRPDKEMRGLPVVQACHRNFVARGPGAADADCILDQTTLSAMTLAVDRAAGGDGARTDLAALLVELTG